jgi:hypothetical protein
MEARTLDTRERILDAAERLFMESMATKAPRCARLPARPGSIWRR